MKPMLKLTSSSGSDRSQHCVETRTWVNGEAESGGGSSAPLVVVVRVCVVCLALCWPAVQHQRKVSASASAATASASKRKADLLTALRSLFLENTEVGGDESRMDVISSGSYSSRSGSSGSNDMEISQESAGGEASNSITGLQCGRDHAMVIAKRLSSSGSTENGSRLALFQQILKEIILLVS